MDKPSLTAVAPGVKLCFIKTSQFKTSRISVDLLLPLDDDAAANTLLIYLLCRSCREYPDFTALNGRLYELYGASVGAHVTKLGEGQLISLAITSIDDRFALDGESVVSNAANLLFNLLFEPNLVDGKFVQSDIEREKRLLLERIESERDDKQAYALERCSELMCDTEVFGKSRFGTPEQVEALTGDDVLAAWHRALETATVQITAVASAGEDELKDKFGKAFSAVKRKPVAAQTAFVTDCGEPRRFEEEQPITQGKLVLGMRTEMKNARDNISAMTVMNDLFGGGTYSKLFSNVREKLSLCYYCSSSLVRGKGIMFVQSGIETQNEERATSEILRQLDLLKSGDFSDDDFNASILALEDRYARFGDTPEKISAWYLTQLLYDEPVTPAQQALEISKVTRQDVVDAARGVRLDTVFMLAGKGGDENEG